MPETSAAQAGSKAQPHVVLFVDDERNILSSVQRILRRAPYRVLTANSPELGLELIQKHAVTLVVSDFRMPTMDGVSFLEKVRDLSPDTVRMLLTGFADTDSAIRAINNGNVFRYLKKPIREPELLEALRTGVRQYELVVENRRLMELTRKQNAELKKFNQELEKKVQERTRELTQQKQELQKLYDQLESSFTETIRAFMTVIEMKNPTLGGHSRRVAALARRFAEFLKLPQETIRDIEVAALLHDIGKITLPDEISFKAEAELSPHEYELMKAHPEIGASIVADIQSLKNAADIIASHHERFDGSGYPHGIRGEKIPLGARLVAVVNTFDNMISHENLEKKVRYELALKCLHTEQGKRFDARIAAKFLQFLKTSRRFTRQYEESPVEISDLQPGMVLARDIKTTSGLLLLGKDQKLNATLIRRIQQYHLIDPVQTPIYILDIPQQEQG